jgi:hypothetical protein
MTAVETNVREEAHRLTTASSPRESQLLVALQPLDVATVRNPDFLQPCKQPMCSIPPGPTLTPHAGSSPMPSAVAVGCRRRLGRLPPHWKTTAVVRLVKAPPKNEDLIAFILFFSIRGSWHKEEGPACSLYIFCLSFVFMVAKI